MTVKQVIEYLQMDGHAIYKLAYSSKILAIKITGQERFKKEVIDKWINDGSLENLNKE